MKKKILIANRSEIACRIFQACRELGFHTVGIVAPGDEEARHVTYADEVFQVPSYLDIPSILNVAVQSQAKLIHPGYGFLSERPAFARAVEGLGFIFIGPTAETMEMMGGKIAAKELAAREHVPTLPWAKVPVSASFSGISGSSLSDDVLKAAQKVGFPLLLKASAGGGGKGMRRVERAADLASAAESAAAEALSAFGDGTLFLERCIDRPRHIEVQVFGDGHGNGIHLFERECSLQRRHQKIWEEAPAPHLSNKTREGLFQAALRLVKATRYRNAGTIEFLVDAQENFYFLEMNTRLQVEHPITELVTGVDLVWAQIQQACNPGQSTLVEIPNLRGHAIEVRIYAEDPAQGFIPTPGKILKLRWPTGCGIRIESGIEEGQTVGTQFDSMLAKLIVYAQTREQALERLKFALEETIILGIGTNQSYLRALADCSHVKEGKMDTGLLEKLIGLENLGPNLSEDDIDLLFALKKEGIGRSYSKYSRLNSEEASSAYCPSPWSRVKLNRNK